jgi:hypothetical protein
LAGQTARARIETCSRPIPLSETHRREFAPDSQPPSSRYRPIPTF